MEPIEVEMTTELPPEQWAETAEKTGNTYSSVELAKYFQTSDRTIRNWIKRLREIFYWCPEQLTVGNRYSQFCYDQLQAYKKEVVEDGTAYHLYRDGIWSQQAPTIQAQANAVVLSAHRDNVIATSKLDCATEVLQDTKQTIQEAYQQQPILAKGLAKLFAARFKQEFAQEYGSEIKQAVKEVLNTTEFDRE